MQMLQFINTHIPNTILTPPPYKYNPHPLFKPSLSPSHFTKPTPLFFLSSHTRPQTTPLSATQDDGPIEISPEIPSIFATDDNPTPLQLSTSVLLTGSITVFLFRSIRRRIKRSKELRMRSTGATKTLKEEALDSLKAVQSISIESKASPSPVQTLLGGLTAGVIALILYKFTTTIEAGLNQQTLSDTLSVRQITVTVRTIINGICYLATFIFGINSIGLFLYSGQLALNSLSQDTANNDLKNNDEKQASSFSPSSESSKTTDKDDSDQAS